jgi:hypothetical protein
MEVARGERAMPTEEEIKAGLKAFKKRIKAMRLDDESNLSRAGGRKSGILGISPPAGHAPEVWEELVKRGRLKREMGGTYSLVEDGGRMN